MREPTVIGRGRIDLPGLPQMIVGALELRDQPPACNPVHTALDLLLYTFTPLRIRMNRPGQLWLSCEAGTALLIPAYSSYVLDTAATPADSHHAWFTFQNLARHPLHTFVQNEAALARFLDPDGRLGRWMVELAATAQQGTETAFWPMQYQGQEIMRALLQARRIEPGLYELGGVVCASETTLTARVTHYLEANLAQPIKLPDIARAMRVSLSTLSHVYRLQAGESPLQTLRRIRIHQVKTLLLQNLILAAIAEMTGFYDAHHVSREFRRAEGISTSRFLELIRRIPAPP